MGMPASNIGAGQCFAFPDVCKTPTPAGPVPIPYPNMAMNTQPILPTASLNVMIGGKNAVMENTQIMMSSGDEPGAVGGVISNMIKGPAQFKLGSMTVKVNGRGLCYLGSLAAQNNTSNANMPAGAQIVPSQVQVLTGP